jgi:hypothetical protein
VFRTISFERISLGTTDILDSFYNAGKLRPALGRQQTFPLSRDEPIGPSYCPGTSPVPSHCPRSSLGPSCCPGSNIGPSYCPGTSPEPSHCPGTFLLSRDGPRTFSRDLLIVPGRAQTQAELLTVRLLFHRRGGG